MSETENNKPNASLDDIKPPIIRMDADRVPDTVALNAGIRNREIIENARRLEAERRGKQEGKDK
jgi:hypothetical protein